MLSASKIFFETSAWIGEGDYGPPDIGKYVDTSSGSWNDKYPAVYEAAASGGSYAAVSGSVSPFSAESHGEALLNWNTPPGGVNFAWPRVMQSHSISPLLAVPAGTPYTVTVMWGIEMNNSSGQPEHKWSEPNRGVNYWQGTGTFKRGEAGGKPYTVSGRTGGTPIIIDGIEYYRVEGYGNSVNINQNASFDNPRTHTGFVTNDVVVYVQIDEGDAPEVEIHAPEDAHRGEVVRLDSFAWDPDNGPESDGNGVIYYRWMITSPSGNTTLHEGTEIDAIDQGFGEIGDYDVLLTVVDDEGMTSSVNHTISVNDGVDLVPQSLAIFAKSRPLSFEQALPVNWSLSLSALVQNNGRTDADPSTATFYLSRDSAIGDQDDLVIASVPVPRIGSGIGENVTLLVPGGLDELIKMPGAGYSQWHGAIHIGIVVDSGSVITESDEANNIATSSVMLVDGVPERRTVADDLSMRQAEEWLARNGYDETLWVTRELPGYLPGFKGGDLGWYKPLSATKTFVSPYDGTQRDGRWYRQQARIVSDEAHPGKYKITLQGTETFGEPDPWFASKRVYRLPWWQYVAKWHNSF